MDVRVAFIHGDLNMENVLVDMDTETIHLIDFAKSGRSHVIRDLLHLEMAVINKILSEEMQESDSAAAVMDDLYCRLHCILTTSKSIPPPQGLEKPFTILKTIREAARPLIFQTASWQEYYTGLFIYLLGSLRFPDLNDMPSAPFPKQLAFWGSAVILDLLENEPDCTQFEASKTAVATTQSKPQSKVAPTSTEPETGSTIWDSDKIVADWQTDTLSQRITLFNILKTNFSMDELVELGLHVGVELEDLPGSGRPRKAQELIGYFERRGQIRTLIEGIRSVRPTIEWR
jgi:hypothetical protein